MHIYVCPFIFTLIFNYSYSYDIYRYWGRRGRYVQDFRIELAPARKGVPPTVKLDDLYKSLG